MTFGSLNGTTYSIKMTIFGNGNVNIIGNTTANSFIKSGGTSAQFLKADGSVSTLSNPVTGSGTTNYLPKFTGSTTIGNSNLINDASGNLGLGVTPSAWNIGSPVIQMGTGVHFFGAGIQAQMGSNNFYNGTNYIYSSSNFASRYLQNNGNHIWENAPSGTLGNAITFNSAMTLTSGGNVLIGTTTDAGFKLDVNGTGRFSGALTGTQSLFNSTSTQLILQNTDGGTNAEKVGMFMTGGDVFKLVSLNDNNTTRVDNVLTANVLSGNVGIGTASPATKLSILSSTASSSTLDAIFNITNDIDSNIRVFVTGSNATDKRAGIGPTTNTALCLITNNTEQMRITSGGNVLIGTTTDSGQRLQVNGDFYAEKQSGNASLFFKRIVNDTKFEISVQESRTRIRTWQTANDRDLYFDSDQAGTTRMIITGGGNVLIGTTTDNGSKLRVNGSIALPHTTKSANYTLDGTDYTVGFDCASNRTANLPDATTCAGRIYVIYQYNTNVGVRYVTLDGNGSQTINGLTTVSLQYNSDYSSVMIQSNGSNWVIISDAVYPSPT
jgi:hypothetical protein